MRFLFCLITCSFLLYGQLAAQEQTITPKKKTYHKKIKVKEELQAQSKRTLSLEEKKKDIIKNPDPAIYNDIRDAFSDGVEENPAIDDSDWYGNNEPGKVRGNLSSMGSDLKGLMKNHNLMFGKIPYSLQGLPIIYTSKSTGLNLGARISLADMEYEQPYIYRLAFQYWVSDRGVRKNELELDIPNFFSKKWHIRFDYKYNVDIDDNFFGIGNRSIFNQDLVTPQNPSFISRTYYQYKLTYPSFTFDIDYKIFSEVFSIYAGIGLEKATVEPLSFDYKSRIYMEQPYGYGGGKTNYVRAGIMFDTRDFPFNPTKGIVIAATYTDHEKFIKSDYVYKNLDITYMGFFSFFRYFTLAHRIMADQIWGNPPFFALAEFRSYQSYQGLGGGDLLRGAPNFRFIDNLKFVNQIELRTRFYNGVVWGQHLQVNVNPFWDFGRVWDKRQKFTFDNFHNTFGSEFRFTWNANFIAAFTVGVGSEATTTSLSFGESFD